MFDKNDLKKVNDNLKAVIQDYERLNSLYTTYYNISKDILEAYKMRMSFIPFSDWIKVLDMDHSTNEINENTKNLIVTLKTDLKNLANLCGYTIVDGYGFLPIQEKENNNKTLLDTQVSQSSLNKNASERPEIYDHGKPLTISHLSEFLRELPPNMEMRIESDSYDFPTDFKVTASWLEDNNVVVYGNPMDD